MSEHPTLVELNADNNQVSKRCPSILQI